jgi:hypothetical protein
MSHFASPPPHGGQPLQYQNEQVRNNQQQITSTRVRLESLNNSVDYANGTNAT